MKRNFVCLVLCAAVAFFGCDSMTGSDSSSDSPGAAATIADVTRFAAVPGDAQIALSWVEPANVDFACVEISGTGFPAKRPAKGVPNVTVTGLVNGREYSFTAKVVDKNGKTSNGVTIKATPALATVPVSSIWLSKTCTSGSVTLEASFIPENATKPSLVWSSSDESVATVSAYGAVEVLKKGYADIKAATPDGAISAICKVRPFDERLSTLSSGGTYGYRNFAYSDATGWVRVDGQSLSIRDSSLTMNSVPIFPVPGYPEKNQTLQADGGQIWIEISSAFGRQTVYAYDYCIEDGDTARLGVPFLWLKTEATDAATLTSAPDPASALGEQIMCWVGDRSCVRKDFSEDYRIEDVVTWSIPAAMSTNAWSSPYVDARGNTYLASYAGPEGYRASLFVLNANGEQVSEIKLYEDYGIAWGDIRQAGDGSAVFIADQSKVYRLSSDNRSLTYLFSGSFRTVNPDPSGFIVDSGWAGSGTARYVYVKRYAADGSITSQFTIDGAQFMGANDYAIADGDGNVYVKYFAYPSSDGRLFKYDGTGRELKDFTLIEPSIAWIASFPGNRVWFDGRILAANGNIVADYPHVEFFNDYPYITSDGSVYTVKTNSDAGGNRLGFTVRRAVKL